ncbi:MAG: hypothetical protein JO328_10830 [Hyphomicrobiales bacterium]|nr:hypothetical protein [Hyphomicrobiales bacterium]MBV8827143.1 hypothetical protein [Hyphomicrobiales bacterium]MBV9427959.1 hypothetical protein [Bradyrhizobiaceae bacterium]
MDVAWQDGVGSFLDSSGTDPSSFVSFTEGDGTLWSSSADSPLFSGQSVLWESGLDSPADSHISGLTVDSTNGTDTGTWLAGSWLADGTPGLADGTLQGGLLWGSAGSETPISLASNGGVGLGALELGASSGDSQWQQFVDHYAGGSATGLTDVPHLLWTGAGSQSAIVPVPNNSQPVHIALNDTLPLATVGSVQPSVTLPEVNYAPPTTPTGLEGAAAQQFSALAPQQLVWTDPTHGQPAVAEVASAAPSTLAGAGPEVTSILSPIGSAGSH